MAPRKKQLQTRLSRSARMRNATVKRATLALPDEGRPHERAGRGAPFVEPTPAIDAVLARVPWSASRRLILPLCLLLALTALAVQGLLSEIELPSFSGESWTSALWALTLLSGTLAIGTALVLIRTVVRTTRAISGERRRCLLASGTIKLYERSGRRFSQQWLVTPRGERLSIKRHVLTAVTSGTKGDPEDVSHYDPRTIGRRGQANSWTLLDARMLYHHETETVFEVRNAEGVRLYQHPRYRPDADDDPMSDAALRDARSRPEQAAKVSVYRE